MGACVLLKEDTWTIRAFDQTTNPKINDWPLNQDTNWAQNLKKNTNVWQDLLLRYVASVLIQHDTALTFRMNIHAKMEDKYNFLFSLSLKIHSYKGMLMSTLDLHTNTTILHMTTVQFSFGFWRGHGSQLADEWESVSWLWFQISMAWSLSISSWCGRVTKHTGAGKTTYRLLHWRCLQTLWDTWRGWRRLNMCWWKKTPVLLLKHGTARNTLCIMSCVNYTVCVYMIPLYCWLKRCLCFDMLQAYTCHTDPVFT